MSFAGGMIGLAIFLYLVAPERCGRDLGRFVAAYRQASLTPLEDKPDA